MKSFQYLHQCTNFITLYIYIYIYIAKKKSGCITECSSGGEEAKSENDLEFEGEKNV